MGHAEPPTLRTPLMLLAAVNLAILGMRLWPWQDVPNLPGNGTTGFDPAISLLAYIGLIPWMAGNPKASKRKALSIGTMIGLVAGVLLVVEVVIATRSEGQGAVLKTGLLATAGLLWGIAGLRGAKAAGGSAAIGSVAGAWSAMVSCLMACTAVLLEINPLSPLPQTLDPWKQYEALAIGNQATQQLVHSLIVATGFLLIGPLVGAAAGPIFVFFAKTHKS